jgi:hypothetical protein
VYVYVYVFHSLIGVDLSPRRVTQVTQVPQQQQQTAAAVRRLHMQRHSSKLKVERIYVQLLFLLSSSSSLSPAIIIIIVVIINAAESRFRNKTHSQKKKMNIRIKKERRS